MRIRAADLLKMHRHIIMPDGPDGHWIWVGPQNNTHWPVVRIYDATRTRKCRNVTPNRIMILVGKGATASGELRHQEIRGHRKIPLSRGKLPARLAAMKTSHLYNRFCCNPDHFVLANRIFKRRTFMIDESMRRRRSIGGRKARKIPIEVAEDLIREYRENGRLAPGRSREVAEKYGVSPAYISFMARNTRPMADHGETGPGGEAGSP